MEIVFKLGDRVRFLEDHYNCADVRIGQTGIVSASHNDDGIFYIKMDHDLRMWAFRQDDSSGIALMQKEESKPTGTKFDSGKPKVSLVTKEFIYGTTKALEYGAEKYGRDNFKLGMEWTRVIDAAQRHILEFTGKEDFDKESNLNHLYHAAANLNMLIYMYENKLGKDDR